MATIIVRDRPTSILFEIGGDNGENFKSINKSQISTRIYSKVINGTDTHILEIFETPTANSAGRVPSVFIPHSSDITLYSQANADVTPNESDSWDQMVAIEAVIDNFKTMTTIEIGDITLDASSVAINKIGDDNIAQNAGALSDGVQRVTIATDDSLNVKIGAKSDARSTATDTTEVSVMSVLKEISYMEQNPASVSVTGSVSAASSIADGSDVTFGAKADAKSAATDNTAITAMQVLKYISYMLQNPAANFSMTSGNYNSTFDGSAAYLTTNTLTLSGFPFTVSSTICTVKYVKITRLSGAQITITSDNTSIGIATSANILTVTGATPFLGTDTKYEVSIEAQQKAYDLTQDSLKVIPPIPHYTSSPIPIISSAQTVTTSWADLGYEIDCSNMKTASLLLKYTIQNMLGLQIQFLPKHTSAGTEEYNRVTANPGNGVINLTSEIWQLPDSNNMLEIPINIDYKNPIIQVQVRALYDGGTDATIDTANIVLGY